MLLVHRTDVPPRPAALLAILLGLALLAATPADARAAEPAAESATTAPRILLQESRLAGFRHHGADAIWESLAVGDRLDLVREPDNPHDRNAVRVERDGRVLAMSRAGRTHRSPGRWIAASG